MIQISTEEFGFCQCSRLPAGSWPIAAFLASQWFLFVSFLSVLSKQTLFLPYISPCLSTSSSLHAPSKLPPNTNTGFLNVKCGLQSINNFWAIFHVPACNKGRLTTQSMIFSKCQKAWTPWQCAYLYSVFSSGSTTTQNFEIHMPRGEESKPTATKLYSLCEFGWIALNSETSPLTTPTQQLFFWLWNAPVTQKAHFQLHILFCFEPKGSCCSVTAVKLIGTRSTLLSTLSSEALNRPPWNPTNYDYSRYWWGLLSNA